MWQVNIWSKENLYKHSVFSKSLNVVSSYIIKFQVLVKCVETLLHIIVSPSSYVTFLYE